jgi:hypothetical protein
LLSIDSTRIIAIGESILTKERLATVFLIVLTNTIGATVMLPMMPLCVEKQFGATRLQATLVIAMFYVA